MSLATTLALATHMICMSHLLILVDVSLQLERIALAKAPNQQRVGALLISHRILPQSYHIVTCAGKTKMEGHMFSILFICKSNPAYCFLSENNTVVVTRILPITLEEHTRRNLETVDP